MNFYKVVFLLSFVFYACQKPVDIEKIALQQVVEVLEKAGDYSQTGQDAKLLAMLYRELGSAPAPQKKELYRHYLDSLQINFDADRSYDYHQISSDYLINYINQVFDTWEKAPWKNNYRYTTFCEYVLPYRMSDEKLTESYYLNRQHD